jgi:5-methylcytosine-specific restriction endonuclease McrA
MDTANLPKTRKEAQALGAKYYFTGEPCKHGHIAPRKTKGSCVECLKVEWTEGNEKRAEYFRQYNQSAAGKKAKEGYYERNREVVIARASSRPLSEKRVHQKAWKDRNLIWVRADTKSRRRKHRNATPKWLTRAQKAEMRELYKIAITMTKTTGEKYVVDHIVPLRAEHVCGLHVPWNLRVITQEENLRKSNKLVDTPSDTTYIETTKTINPPDSFLGADDMQTGG